MDNRKMTDAAKRTMRTVLDLVAEDKVLVVTDRDTEAVGDAFLQAALETGCEADKCYLPEADRPLQEVPSGMIGRLEGKTVVLNLFQGMGEETPFRVRWINKIVETKKIRLGHSPNITPAMMIDGPLDVDYDEMMAQARRLMKSFEHAVSAHITAPGGTDVILGIEDRGFQTDVHITVDNPGNLPCGEIWCGPVEDGADGVLVIDGSIGDVGNVSRPLTLTLQKGRITDLACEDPDLLARIRELIAVDEEASVIGELGIGLNRGAKLTGILLEDEKAFDTAHIAFGNNEDMPGGKNRSKTHRDFLFYKPTFEVTFKDGSTRVLIEEGRFLI